jgi:hypothetical protein
MNRLGIAQARTHGPTARQPFFGRQFAPRVCLEWRKRFHGRKIVVRNAVFALIAHINLIQIVAP